HCRARRCGPRRLRRTRSFTRTSNRSPVVNLRRWRRVPAVHQRHNRRVHAGRKGQDLRVNAAQFIIWLILNLSSHPVSADGDANTFCTAFAVYTEARGESWDGQAAVAQVVVNRSAKLDGNTCAVIFAPYQFSGVTSWKVGKAPWIAE